MRLPRVSNIADPMLPYKEKRTNILKQIVKEITTKMKKIHPNNYVLSVCVV